MVKEDLFYSMAQYNPKVYIDSTVIIGERFLTEVYPALDSYNKQAPADERIIITVLASCVNQIKYCIKRGKQNMDENISKRAEQALEIIRRDSEKHINFVCYENPDSKIYAAELLAEICKQKITNQIYVMTNKLSLREDIHRLDAFDCYIKKYDKKRGIRYGAHNKRVLPVGHEKGLFHVIVPPKNNEAISSGKEMFMIDEIDFDALKQDGCELFLDCSFIANKAFEDFDKKLSDYNALREDKLQFKIATPCFMELNRLAFDKSESNSEYAQKGLSIIGSSLTKFRGGNYIRTEGNGCDYFFDAFFLSHCFESLLNNPVAVFTADRDFTEACHALSEIKSFNPYPVYTYNYDGTGVVRSSEIGCFYDYVMGL